MCLELYSTRKVWVASFPGLPFPPQKGLGTWQGERPGYVARGKAWVRGKGKGLGTWQGERPGYVAMGNYTDLLIASTRIPDPEHCHCLLKLPAILELRERERDYPTPLVACQ